MTNARRLFFPMASLLRHHRKGVGGYRTGTAARIFTASVVRLFTVVTRLFASAVRFLATIARFFVAIRWFLILAIARLLIFVLFPFLGCGALRQRLFVHHGEVSGGLVDLVDEFLDESAVGIGGGQLIRGVDEVGNNFPRRVGLRATWNP